MPLDRNRRRRTRFSLLYGDPYTPSSDAAYSGGDGGICLSWPVRPGNARMRVLQTLNRVSQTLVPLSADSVWGSRIRPLHDAPRPLPHRSSRLFALRLMPHRIGSVRDCRHGADPKRQHWLNVFDRSQGAPPPPASRISDRRKSPGCSGFRRPAIARPSIRKCGWAPCGKGGNGRSG